MKKYFAPLAMILLVNAQAQPSSAENHPDWQSYKGAEFGFSARYPSAWKCEVAVTEIDPITREHPSGMSYPAFQEKGPPLDGVTGDGRKVKVENYQTQWAVYRYPPMPGQASFYPKPPKMMETLISSLGKDFNDRKVVQTKMAIADHPAVKVVVNGSAPKQTAEVVMIVHGDTLYAIQNLQTGDQRFDDFCESFHFL